MKASSPSSPSSPSDLNREKRGKTLVKSTFWNISQTEAFRDHQRKPSGDEGDEGDEGFIAMKAMKASLR